MATLKYKLIPAGAAEGRVPINLIFIIKEMLWQQVLHIVRLVK